MVWRFTIELLTFLKSILVLEKKDINSEIRTGYFFAGNYMV